MTSSGYLFEYVIYLSVLYMPAVSVKKGRSLLIHVQYHVENVLASIISDIPLMKNIVQKKTNTLITANQEMRFFSLIVFIITIDLLLYDSFLFIKKLGLKLILSVTNEAKTLYLPLFTKITDVFSLKFDIAIINRFEKICSFRKGDNFFICLDLY